MRNIDWSTYDELLPKYNSEELARIIGCHSSSIKQRRSKLGIPSPGKESERRNKELAKKGMRYCPGCNRARPLESFGHRSTRKCAAYCKQCHNKKSNKRRANQGHRLTLLRKLGKENIDVYERLFIEQDGRCAICENQTGSVLYLDHNHETGRLRGLLCQKCNSGLGILGDTKAILERAMKYVERAEYRTDLPTLRS